MVSTKFLERLFKSLIIGGQAINYIFKGKISKNDLTEQLMESGPGSFLIVLITGIAAGTVFNIQVASQLTGMGVSSEIGGLLAVGMAREMAITHCNLNDRKSCHSIRRAIRHNESNGAN